MKLSRALIAPLAALALFSAHAADKLRIGVVPGAYADSVAVAAREAKAQGIDVQVVEFTDWTTPNVAVDSGDLDINYFQHQPFLDNAIQKNGYKLASAGTGILANVGLYSLKHKAIAQVPQGGKVGIANDPVNQGRGLLLLQKVGLIKLKPGVGYLGSLDDIVENPKKLSFVEVEGRSWCASRATWTSPRATRTSSWRPRPSIRPAGLRTRASRTRAFPSSSWSRPTARRTPWCRSSSASTRTPMR